MNKKINKEGISLAVLAITIVVSIILLSALTVNLNSNIKKSKISKFVYDISNIEDALNSYYILKNELPKNSEELDINGLKAYQTDEELYNEITKNNDTKNTFYFLNLDEIGVENTSYIKENKDQYVFSYPNFNVYYLKGEKIGNIKYFSITDKIDEKILKNNDNSVDNSVISVNKGDGLKVVYDGSNWKNKLQITTEYNSTSYKLNISVVDVNNVTKNFLKTNGEKNFENATDIDSSLANVDIKKIIFELKNSNNEIISSETINTSNYDPLSPSISNADTNGTYEDMNTISFDLKDEGKSGLKEVRYEYIGSDYVKKDLEYMKTKAKSMDVSEITNGRISIKVPKDINTVEVVVIDNAGNCSSPVLISGY